MAGTSRVVSIAYFISVSAFAELIKNGAGYFDFYLDYLCRTNDIASDRGQREVARAMATALAKTGDGILFDRYARHTALRLGVDPIKTTQGFQKLAKEAAPPPRPQHDDSLTEEPEPEEERPRPSPPELWILKLALLGDENLEWLAAHLDFHWIEHADVRAILELRLNQREDGSWPPPPDVLHDLPDANAQSLLTEAATEPRAITDPMNLLKDTLLRLRNLYIDRQAIQMAGQMGNANLTGEELSDLLRRQRGLIALRTQPLTPISDASEF